MSAIHIVNPFGNAFGGSEQRALGHYRRLKGRAEVRLWSHGEPDPRLAARYPIQRIGRTPQSFPCGGTWVIVGAYFTAEQWFHLLRPRRLIFIYNTDSPNFLAARLEAARRATGIEPEIVYASRQSARQIGLPGRLEPSPIDLQRFHPARRDGVARPPGRFVVGRFSRDDPVKHHRGDLAVYREALRRGWSLRLMGASCLAGELAPAGDARAEFLACGAEPPERFLAQLDCFYYRVSEQWTETFGRVVLEAMASGLPVLCQRRVGGAELIEDGRDGFVVSGGGEALALLQRLRDDAALRSEIGAAARRKMEQVYSAAYEEELVRYYTA